jgi:hypothetical protein
MVCAVSVAITEAEVASMSGVGGGWPPRLFFDRGRFGRGEGLSARAKRPDSASPLGQSVTEEETAMGLAQEWLPLAAHNHG